QSVLSRRVDRALDSVQAVRRSEKCDVRQLGRASVALTCAHLAEMACATGAVTAVGPARIRALENRQSAIQAAVVHRLERDAPGGVVHDLAELSGPLSKRLRILGVVDHDAARSSVQGRV